MVKKWKEKVIINEVKVQWVHIARPDTKFDKDGVYRLEGIIEADNEFIATVDTLIEKAKAYAESQLKNKKKQLIPVYPYEELEDGSYKVKAKARAVLRFDDEVRKIKIPVYDAKVKPIDPMEVTRGSIVNVQVILTPYYMPATNTYGLSIRLHAVQLLEKGNDFGGDIGFKPVDGYVADDIPDFSSASNVPVLSDDAEDDIDADF